MFRDRAFARFSIESILIFFPAHCAGALAASTVGAHGAFLLFRCQLTSRSRGHGIWTRLRNFAGIVVVLHFHPVLVPWAGARLFVLPPEVSILASSFSSVVVIVLSGA